VNIKVFWGLRGAVSILHPAMCLSMYVEGRRELTYYETQLPTKLASKVMAVACDSGSNVA
jgi:hypothetical protein